MPDFLGRWNIPPDDRDRTTANYHTWSFWSELLELGQSKGTQRLESFTLRRAARPHPVLRTTGRLNLGVEQNETDDRPHRNF